jgi:hypothetical protein
LKIFRIFTVAPLSFTARTHAETNDIIIVGATLHFRPEPFFLSFPPTTNTMAPTAFQCLLCLPRLRVYSTSRDAWRHVRNNHPGKNDRANVVEVGGNVNNNNVGAVGQPAAVAAAPSLPGPLLPVAPAADPPRPMFDGPVVNNLRSQLRSSRSTRNQEHPAARRAGPPDFDPTDGLPVRQWALKNVRISQDAPAEAGEATNLTSEATDNDLWSAEPALPSFFSQLPPHNQVSPTIPIDGEKLTNSRQELIRAARRTNPNPKISIWDPKTESYICGIDMERREAARKGALNKPKSDATAPADPAEEDDDKVADDEAEDPLDADGLPEKRRKTNTTGASNNYFEVRKWVPVPAAVAETMPERKYLADRRPGMPSLYKGAYKATNGFGTLGDMVAAAISGGATDYDFGGDLNGLSNAQSLLAPGSGSANWNGGSGALTDGATTPVRKNIPPRRKKKGGPGRKPKNWKPENTLSTTEATTEAATTDDAMTTENTAGATATGEADTLMTDTTTAPGENITDANNREPAEQGETNIHDQDGEGDGSESESEREGSEEGEIGGPPLPANEPVHGAVTGNAVPSSETETEMKPDPEKQMEMESESVAEPAAADTAPEGALADMQLKGTEETEHAEKMEVDKNPDETVPTAVTPAAELTESIPDVAQDHEPEPATAAEEVANEVDVLGALEAALDEEATQGD